MTKTKKVTEFKHFKGLTFVSVEAKVGNDLITFTTDDGRIFELYHSQDCCESVSIEDINGDLSDLVGTPVLRAAERTNSEKSPKGVEREPSDSFTWTFYRISTIKGTVVFRWLGESNSYYSESVDFRELTPSARA